MRNVQQEIARAIQARVVVTVTKTKGRLEGGRQLVSVGPYQTAVPERSKKFAVITKNDVLFSSGAATAAQTFVHFVGRDMAWDALLRAYSKSGKSSEVKRLEAQRLRS